MTGKESLTSDRGGGLDKFISIMGNSLAQKQLIESYKAEYFANSSYTYFKNSKSFSNKKHDGVIAVVEKYYDYDSSNKFGLGRGVDNYMAVNKAVQFLALANNSVLDKKTNPILEANILNTQNDFSPEERSGDLIKLVDYRKKLDEYTQHYKNYFSAAVNFFCSKVKNKIEYADKLSRDFFEKKPIPQDVSEKRKALIRDGNITEVLELEEPYESDFSKILFAKGTKAEFLEKYGNEFKELANQTHPGNIARGFIKSQFEECLKNPAPSVKINFDGSAMSK